MENIQGHHVLEIGSEWGLLALYIVRHAPTLQFDNPSDNRHTLKEQKSASDRGGARALLTASACTSSTIRRCRNSGMARSRRKLARTKGCKNKAPPLSRDHVVCFVTEGRC